MTNLTDVAAYIQSTTCPIPIWKLQILCYLSQAMSLAWNDKPLFENVCYATKDGPYCGFLDQKKMRCFDSKGRKTKLSYEQKNTINTVLKNYGDKNKQWFGVYFESEQPFKNALLYLNNGLTNGAISKESMKKFHTCSKTTSIKVDDVKVSESNALCGNKKYYSLEYAGCIIDDIPYLPDEKQKDIFKRTVIEERNRIWEANATNIVDDNNLKKLLNWEAKSGGA